MAVFYNQATLRYSGGVTSSNQVSGQILDALEIGKTAISASYQPGGAISYAVSLVNSSEGDMEELTVADNLGAFEFDGETVYPLEYVDGTVKYFVDGVLQGTPEVEDGPPLRISGIDVPANASAMLLYEAAVTEFAPLGEGAEITNTARVTGPCVSAALSVSATVAASCQPRLTISKSVCPAVIVACDPVTYTFVIQNSGCACAGQDAEIVLSDLFDPILRDIEVLLDGEALGEDCYSYDESTGAFSTEPGCLTVPAATVSQNADGSWTTDPGITVVTVTGRL